MRLRDLLPYTRRAIDLTMRRVEDRDRGSPTWDGRFLHIARLKREDHVLHEVAHWIVAAPSLRAYPNYGCGTDPDKGGPQVDVLAGAGEIDTFGMDQLLAAQAMARDAVARSELADVYEKHASLITVVLMRHARLNWLEAARRHWLVSEDTIALAWETIAILTHMGIDCEDPLRPFEARR